MRTTPRLVLAVLAAITVSVGACASTSQGGGTDFAVPIEVDNTLSDLTSATIYIVRTSGSGRRLLGPVETSSKRTFDYDARVGNYRLIARKGTGLDSIVSDQFRLDPGTVVQWTLGVNRLLTGTR